MSFPCSGDTHYWFKPGGMVPSPEDRCACGTVTWAQHTALPTAPPASVWWNRERIES